MRAGGPAARAGFRQVLAAEWIKFRSVRSTVWTTVATFVVPVAATGSLQDDDTVIGGSLTPSVVAQTLAAVVGAMTITGEYGSGTIRTTLAANPNRGTVVAAKAALAAGLMYVLALGSCVLAVAVGGVLLPASHPAGEALPALFGIAGSFAVAGLLGLAVGTLVRHSADAVTTVVGLLPLPSLLGPLFGGARRWIAGLSPTAALEKLTQTSDATAETVGSLWGPGRRCGWWRAVRRRCCWWPWERCAAATPDGRPGRGGSGEVGQGVKTYGVVVLSSSKPSRRRMGRLWLDASTCM
ncbi:ABC transporter permease [Streptomyces niveus]|uniref:ABC transporter permease n=1 Tax=Streptomyces niveus TaxID=193462 RepID=UPI00369A187F